MGAEHSRRSHARRQRPTSSVPVNLEAPTLVQEDPNKSLASSIGSESVPRKKHRQMDRLRRTLSFRSRKKSHNNSANNTNHQPTTADTTKSKPTNANGTTTDGKPVQWQDDEKSVRLGACSFNVKYLGSVEVQESRGMHVCEQAIQALLNQKGKHMKAVLHISGDALRVVDETNKGLIVDQTIEKVSFCAPDRHHDKGFAYICRDGTTRRWLCHGFLAIKDSGERLSHAVGCAFQICLERKQKRDRECSVTVEYSQNGTSFTRFGSFRTTSITERLIDPQSAIIAEPILSPTTQNSNGPTSSLSQSMSHNRLPTPTERPRPKGSEADSFTRSASLRLGDWNQSSSTMAPFKRQSSLRPSDLPSIQEARQKNLPTNTIPEEVEPMGSTSHELNKLSLMDVPQNGNLRSTDQYSRELHQATVETPSTSMMNNTNNYNNNLNNNLTSINMSINQFIPSNEVSAKELWLTNTSPFIPEQIELTTVDSSMKINQAPSINDAFNSNLTALVQSNNPTNPFSPYGYSIAAQAQSPHLNQRQTTIFTPKRGTNPFDDDLIRR